MALSLTGKIQRRALAIVPAVLVLVVGALAYQQARHVIADVKEVERSHAIIERSDELLTRAVDAETGQRAYLLAGQEALLDPYRGALSDIRLALDSLRNLRRREPTQLARLDTINRLVNERFALLDAAIAMRRNNDMAHVQDPRRLLAGKGKMDELRGAIASLQRQERQVLEQRHAIERRSLSNATAAVGFTAVIALVISALINFAFATAIRERDVANRDLQRVNEDLERQSNDLELQAVEMESQAAELEVTAEDLRATNEELNRATRAAEHARDTAIGVQRQLEHVLRGAKLLSDASRALSSSLDYETTLEIVAQLAVREMADWCAVDLVEADGQIRQAIVAHRDPEKVKWAKELRKRYPPDYDEPGGVGQVIRTGRAEIHRDIPDEVLAAAAKDADHLAILRKLQIKSAQIIPMIARGRTLGALTLVSGEQGRNLIAADESLAMELATRAAIAIDNAQLYRAALTASESKSAFLASMSHELRTPLNAIIGYQSLLRDGLSGPVTDGQLSQLSRIRASADHLLSLIDEVLTFSRVDVGKELVQREQVNLRPVINEAISMVAPVAAARGLKLRDESTDAEMYTDSFKLRQILLNLLSNAVKFSDTGEIVVRSNLDHDSVEISVADSGIGIAEQNLERVFDPFWQVEQRSTRRAGGTGLGLSVSRSLARLLGGDIVVDSQLGKGSTFTAIIPLGLNGGEASDLPR
ncbi:MAG TPA: CHASE3 domain-containing protein [Gemmatimonadaceae bacterium]|nr:CHASE3 domain-containing protein [Gemmatimonadaceae bacterium]